jgi:uncharacterized protein (DUF58 family)
MLTSDLIRAVRRIEIRTRHLVSESFAGKYHAIFKGRGMEFDEVREYAPGDEVRTIDWNVTARMGKPYVKRYVEERELTVMLAFDASASGLFGTAGRRRRELAAELGAVLAFSAITNNDKVGLLAFTDEVELYIPPRRGRRHVLRLVRELLAFEPQGRRTDMAPALAQLNRTLKRHAIVFLISDFLLPYDQPDAMRDYERLLLVTNRRHDVVALCITDPLETSWPKTGLLALADAETGTSTWVDTASPEWRTAFADRAARRRTARDAGLARAKIDRVELTLGDDYIEPLLAFFRARAKRWRR